MSTSLRIASMPAATWASSRSSGPRTAATMQNSVAPVLAVCLAASTRLGMSSQALRTGDAKSPDCEQKWQSSGQPPVLRLMMPSTSTSGPHHFIRTSWASASSSSSRSSGSCSTCSIWSWLRPSPRSSTCSRARARTSVKLRLASSVPYLNSVQVMLAACNCTNATWSTRRPTLLDEYGIADLTMRRLARELASAPARCTGTSPTSRSCSARSPTGILDRR